MSIFPYFILHVPFFKKTHLRIFELMGLHFIIYGLCYTLTYFGLKTSAARVLIQYVNCIPSLVLICFIIYGFMALKLFALETDEPIEKYVCFLGTAPLAFILYSCCGSNGNFINPIDMLSNCWPIILQTFVLTCSLYFMAWTWEHKFHTRQTMSVSPSLYLLKLSIFQAFLSGVIIWSFLITPKSSVLPYIQLYSRIPFSYLLFQQFKLLHSTLYLESWPHVFVILPYIYIIFQSY